MTIIIAFCCLTGGVSAGAAEPSLDWPFYRAAMQWEAAAKHRQEPTRFQWARELNERIGFTVSDASDEDVRRLDSILSLSTARLWSRLKGPRALPPVEGALKMHIAIDTCAKTWDHAEPNMQGLFYAISSWPERPTCLLQRFGTADAHGKQGDDEVALTLRMVGGRLGARGRVVGWPGEKEKGFRALYSVEGPVMTLRSAQVKVPFGWANVMRSGGGAVLLERPMGGNSMGRVNELSARLVYAKPRKNGEKWLDIGRVPTPGFPVVAPVFGRGTPTVDESDSGVVPCMVPDGFVSYIREDSVFWISDRGVFVCADGQLVGHTGTHPFVIIQDAGAGKGATRRVAQVVAHALSAFASIPLTEVLVGQELNPSMQSDHVTVYYRSDADAAVATLLEKNIRLAMPWQAVIQKKVASMPGRLAVQVGW